MHKILMGFTLALGLAFTAAAQTPAQFAPVIRQLGACQAQSMGFQADILEGKLVTWADVKKEIETQNPGTILDLASRKLSKKEAVPHAK